jgi:hypothetical protein
MRDLPETPYSENRLNSATMAMLFSVTAPGLSPLARATANRRRAASCRLMRVGTVSVTTPLCASVAQLNNLRSHCTPSWVLAHVSNRSDGGASLALDCGKQVSPYTRRYMFAPNLDRVCSEFGLFRPNSQKPAQSNQLETTHPLALHIVRLRP